MANEAALRDPSNAPSLIGQGDVAGSTKRVKVKESNGGLYIHIASLDAGISIGGGTEYTEDVAAPADPVGGTILVRKDVALSATAEVDDDWSGLRNNARGALWVELDPTNAVAVTVASIPSHAVTNAGVFAVQATEVDGGNVTLGAKGDAKSTATDTTAITIMSVLKQISASVQAPPTQAASQSGTWTVQPGNTANTTSWLVKLNNGTADTGQRADNADAVAASGTAANLNVSTRDNIFNGTSWDRARSIIDAINSTGTGIAAAGLIAQFDDVSPTAITENQFGAVRMGADRVLYIQGQVAHDGVDTGFPLKQGFQARSTNRAAVSDADRADGISDLKGRQIINLGHVRELRGKQTTTISASTSETTIVTAGGAGVFNDLVALILSNTSASTNTRIDFRDTTAGTILFSLQVPGNQTVGFVLAGFAIPQTTANTNWTAQCATSTTDIRSLAIFEKNT